MNKVKLSHNFAASPSATPEDAAANSFSTSRCVRLGLVTALGFGMAFCPPVSPRAQRVKEAGVKVTSIASSSRGKDGVVSISGDGNLNRAQTFQENGKFHIVLPYAKSDLPNGAPHGVKMQRVGDSLEIIVPVKPGASVTVQPRFNRLDLVVNGGLGDGNAESNLQSDAHGSSVPQTPRDTPREQRDATTERTAPGSAGRRQTANDAAAQAGRQEAMQAARNAAQAQNADAANLPPAATTATNPLATASTEAAAENAPATTQNAAQPVPPAQMQVVESGGESSFFFSLTGLLLVVGALALGALLFVLYRRRASVKEMNEWFEEQDIKKGKLASVEGRNTRNSLEQPFEQYKGDRRKGSVAVSNDRRKAGGELVTHQIQSNGVLVPENGAEKLERRSEPRMSNAGLPAVLFGAYRIDQEVTKLVQGEAHSIDVLASRAIDDRRAIETSLIKVIQSQETAEDGKQRARAALDEYGFVARQSAALLLATDTYDRVSAARVLGQVKAASALPFLLEALYDGEQVVRTEVVASLGALALPKAIGALLDIARRYPEIPASLLGNVLTACSVESLELSWNDASERRSFALTGSREDFTGEITGLEPTDSIEQLPEWMEDETLADALERLSSADTEARIAAAQSLAQFQVQRAVEALSAMTQRDEDGAVRAAAVTSLGHIEHESVFAPVLIALADEAREVRAAAARALSGLNFERADAYVRVIETADRETLRLVAQACLKAGLAAQAVNRLASEDRRQAYEAFTLLSLVAEAGETSFIFEAIEKHADVNVRLAAIRLLGQRCEPETLEQLRALTNHGGINGKVRAAILEMLQQSGQLQEELV